MPPAPLPADEAERLAALRSYDVLDSACEAAFDNIARLATLLTGCPIALVSLVDAERQWFKARIGLEATECPRGESLCAHAILRPDQILVVEDATQDARFQDNPLVTGEAHLRFYAGAPLVNAEGAALGTLCIADRQPRTIGADHREALSHLADTVVTTLELRRAMTVAREASLTDALTGLGNRSALLAAVEAAVARRAQVPFTLLYLDLDGFKRINDLQGHAMGDRVLCQVARTLKSVLASGDVVARLGGDEFAMVVATTTPESVAERVRQALEAEFATQGWPVTASVGAITAREGPLTVDDALAAADAAMYLAKSAGKNRVRHRYLGLPPGSLSAA